MEQLKRLWEWFLGHVASKIKGFLVRLPFWVQLSIVVIVLCCIGYFKYPDKGSEIVCFVKCLGRACQHSKDYPVYLTHDQATALSRETRNLSNRARTQLTALVKEQNAWSIGQLLVALDTTAELNLNEVLAQSDVYYDAEHGCYREYAKDTDGETHVTAWMLNALAVSDAPIAPVKLDFLLKAQNAQGWWAVHQNAKDDPRNASTYATAWAAHALAVIKKKGRIPDGYGQKVSSAIERASEWLRTTKKKGACVWFDYPNREHERKELTAISGLALHTLHLIDPKDSQSDLANLDRMWLRELPQKFAGIARNEVSAISVTMTTGEGVKKDSIRHYPLPWQIMATVDSYENGSLWEKARALKWLNEIADSYVDFSCEIENLPWLDAELLIALKYVAKDTDWFPK